MSHKYRALIGRQSPRPASRGIIAPLKPRRRNCRRAISLAATKQVGQKRFLREKSRFRGLPRNAGHPFGRQGISSSVNAAGIPVGCRASGRKMLPIHRQTYPHTLATKFGRKGDCASHTRVRAATSFDQGVKGRKTPFSPAPSEKYLRHFSAVPNRLGGIYLSSCRPNAKGCVIR